jgi:hypothetical protein
MLSTLLLPTLLALMTSPATEPTVKPAAPAPAAPVAMKKPAMQDPALEKLAAMVGGVWVNVPKDPKSTFIAELRYEFAMNGRAVRCVGVLARGTAAETPMEALYGWDPVAKSVYYVDFHGHETVYKGAVKATAEGLETEFSRIVGPPGEFRGRDEFIGPDRLRSTMWGRSKEGKWVQIHAMEFRRRR